MRLAGIAQINSHVNFFNEMCQNGGAAVAAAAAAAAAACDSPGGSAASGSVGGGGLLEVEAVGLELAAWILQNKIVEHIFGPNLHVEVIKQSHVLLNFLAMEGKSKQYVLKRPYRPGFKN